MTIQAAIDQIHEMGLPVPKSAYDLLRDEHQDNTPVVTRTPMWAMSDRQLEFIAEDDTANHERRALATQVLVSRCTTV